MNSREARERLIDEVKRYPVLYDTRHEHHRDIDVRDRCWADISARLSTNSEVLKREWKILRDSLRQSIKKNRKGATTKAGVPCKKWRFQNRMAFVLPYMTRRNTRQSARHDVKPEADVGRELDAVSELDEDGEPDGRRAGAAREPEDEADALELFFASVCASARRLDVRRRAQLQRAVLDALLRAEAEPEPRGTGAAP